MEGVTNSFFLPDAEGVTNKKPPLAGHPRVQGEDKEPGDLLGEEN